jgi:O-antigen/teichoic acid export membrane protein
VSDQIKKLAGQTAVYGLGTIIPRLLNFLFTPLLTYIFTPAEFGINSELYSYTSFLNVIFLLGMETTFFNFMNRSHNREEVYNTSLVTLMASTLVFSTLLMFFAAQIAGELTTPNATYLTRFIVWIILITATDTLTAIPYARLRSEGKALKFSLLKLLNVVLYVSFTVFFVLICKPAYERGDNTFVAFIYRPEIGIGYVFLANLIANCVSLLFLWKHFRRLKFRVNGELLKEMLLYTWPLIILGLAGTINDTLDRILLKELMPDKVAAQNAQGIYGACYKIAILMTIFTQAFRFASEPFFFSKAKDKDSKAVYAQVMKYFVCFCLLIFLGTVLNLEWIMYFVGKQFRSGVVVVPILLLAYLCYGVIVNLSIWYKLSGQTKYGAVIAIFGAVITLAVNVMFVPRYSYIACAWATLAAYAGMMVLSFTLGQKHFPIRYNLRAIFFYVAFAMGLYALSFLFRNIDYKAARLLLNNLLIVVFLLVLYKFESANLKKVAVTDAPGKSDQ